MALYSGRILVRRGDEINYDPEKLMPGEWALSTDKKIVRICVSPGEVIRMATYDAFEEDMEKIEEILATCQSIQEAVIRINTEISQKADAVAEYTAQAKQYRDEAKQFRDEAETFAPSGYSELVENVEKNTVKIDTVIEKADLRIKETASGENIHLTDSADAKVVEFALYGNATQNGEPTPDAPIDIEVAGSSGSVVVKSIGANLLNYDAWKSTGCVSGTAVFENNGVTITATNNFAYTDFGKWAPENAKIPVGEGDVITLSWEEPSNKNGAILIFAGDTNNNVATYNTIAKSLTYTVPKGIEYITVCFRVENAGDTISYKNIMVNKGSTPLPYEPYKEKSSTIPTPNGLAGIDVDSGGNYTDSNGQQRACDTIVKYADGSGEYIENIKRYSLRIADMNVNDNYPGWTNIEDLREIVGSGLNGVVYGTSNIHSDVFVNTIDQQTIWFLASNLGYTQTELKNKFSDLVVDIYIKRVNPIRTPLTAEQIAEIEKLCTFYPVTNIYNDADCGMKVTYIVDAKRYIDNKIAELATAMVNNI